MRISVIIAGIAVSSGQFNRRPFAQKRFTEESWKPEKLMGKRQEVQESCANELYVCGWTAETDVMSVGQKSIRAVMECMKTYSLDSASADCKPVLEKIQSSAGRKFGKRGDKREEVQESCEDELYECGWTGPEGLMSVDREAARAVMQCMKIYPLDSASADCKPVLEKIQISAGRKFGKRGDKREEVQESCENELRLCGWTGPEIDMMSLDEKNVRGAIMDCMKTYSLDSASADCKPVLEKIQSSAGRKFGTRGDKREEVQESCEDELYECGWTGPEDLMSVDREAAHAVMQCMKVFPLSSASMECQPVLELLQSSGGNFRSKRSRTQRFGGFDQNGGAIITDDMMQSRKSRGAGELRGMVEGMQGNIGQRAQGAGMEEGRQNRGFGGRVQGMVQSRQGNRGQWVQQWRGGQ